MNYELATVFNAHKIKQNISKTSLSPHILLWGIQKSSPKLQWEICYPGQKMPQIQWDLFLNINSWKNCYK